MRPLRIAEKKTVVAVYDLFEKAIFSIYSMLGFIFFRRKDQLNFFFQKNCYVFRLSTEHFAVDWVMFPSTRCVITFACFALELLVGMLRLSPEEITQWVTVIISVTFNSLSPQGKKGKSSSCYVTPSEKSIAFFRNIHVFFLTISLLNGKDKDNRNIAVTQTNLHQLHSQHQIFFFFKFCTKK